MKKFYKSLMSIATAGVIALAPCGSVFATSQDETVYVKLQASGEVKTSLLRNTCLMIIILKNSKVLRYCRI